MPRKLSDPVRFGSFELDLRAGELHRNGETQVLHQQPFQGLLMLIEQDGEIATREEIKKKLWPNDTVVEFDHSINAAIGKLRRALDDSANDPQYIQTVARRGYRLMVPAEWMEDAAEEIAAGAIVGLTVRPVNGRRRSCASAVSPARRFRTIGCWRSSAAAAWVWFTRPRT